MATTPTSVCRYDLAFRMLGATAPGRFLEAGCGAGDFSTAMARRGWTGQAVDLSEESVTQTARRLDAAGLGSRVGTRVSDIVDSEGEFDAVFAFEVFEHIAHDVSAMRHVHEILAPGGVFILSVPAQMSLWTPADDLAGHLRRYERDELVAKLTDAGFSDVEVWSIGVPVVNLIHPVTSGLGALRLARLDAAKRDDSIALTVATGTRKVVPAPDLVYGLLFNRVTLAPFRWLQRAFVATELGRDYIVRARA